MKIFRKIKSFISISSEVKFLFFQAYVLSGLVKLTLIFLPFKRVLNWKGQINVDTPYREDPPSAKYRKSVQQAIILCNKYTLWKTECYTQALTAKILLNRKGIPGTIFIGFKKDVEGIYKGHAWLRSYDKIITGNFELNTYAVHSFYS